MTSKSESAAVDGRAFGIGSSDKQLDTEPNPNLQSNVEHLSVVGSYRECAGDYQNVVVAILSHRVIVCRGNLQWILQRSKRVGPQTRWVAIGYFRTREALIRAWTARTGRIDADLNALPAFFGGR